MKNHKLKSLFLLCLFSACGIGSFAQDQDIFLLKNSEIIRGKLTRDSLNEFLIMLKDTSFMRVQKEEVYSQMKGDELLSDGQIKRRAFKPRKGLFFDLGVDAGFGNGEQGSDAGIFYAVSVTPMISFNDFISAGVGTGIRLRLGVDGYLVPLQGELRLTTRKKISPILVMGAGVGFDPDDGFVRLGDLSYFKVGGSIKTFDGSSIALLFGRDVSPRRLTSPLPAYILTFENEGSIIDIRAYVFSLTFQF